VARAYGGIFAKNLAKNLASVKIVSLAEQVTPGTEI